MATKSPILLHNEAQGALIQTVQYFIQQGVPSYEMKQIIDMIGMDLTHLVDQEIKKAKEEYQIALKKEQEQKQEETKAE